MDSVNKEQIRRARKADLYAYLLANHPSEVRKEGRYLRLKAHDSIVIRIGSSGYARFSNPDEMGNPIDFLVRYMGYTFVDAVIALTSNTRNVPPLTNHALPDPAERSKAPIVLPQRGEQPYRAVFSYLTEIRSVDAELVNALIRKGLLYQDRPYRNAVFINHERTYCEIRGTLPDVKFHRSIRVFPDSVWWFKAGGLSPSQAVFICEAAIDAISLCELMALSGYQNVPAFYCSIGGLGNQKAIGAIEARTRSKVILAVDNDRAGELCRQANAHLQSITPLGKDWNDDLCALKACRNLKLVT